MIKFIFVFLLCFLNFSCNSQGQTPNSVLDSNDNNVKVYDYPALPESEIIVDSVVNLHAKCYRLPSDVTLKFKNGCIKNGTLIGNGTKVIGSEMLFDGVTIKGTWNVEKISSKMFCNLKDTNSLKNVFALANSDINNEIYIQKGNYIVKATNMHPKVLNVPGKTKVVVDGIVMMAENSMKSYSILNVSKATDVSISGNGSLIGDRDIHTGKDGEWGMCISTYDADNIYINGLNLFKGWGDGIYIGKGTKKISISECKIDNCRRQGISVIEGTDVVIKDCIITNINGTAPEYAIDIEPNTKNKASNILIRNVIARNCRGGFAIYTGKNNGSCVENVCIEKCSVIGNKKPAFSVKGAKNVILKNNIVNESFAKYAFNIQRSENVDIIGNTISTQQNVVNDLDNVKMKSNRIRKGNLPSHKKL